MKRRGSFALLLTVTLVTALLSFGSARACTVGVDCKASGGKPPQIAPPFGEAHGALSSGLFMYSKTDLSMAGVLPIEITRVYRSEDRDANLNFIKRDFGVGTSLNYGLYLYSEAEVKSQSNPYANINVVMPDGSQLQCACTAGYNCNGPNGYQPPAQLTCGLTQAGGHMGELNLAVGCERSRMGPDA